MDNEDLRVIILKNLGNTVGDYAEELDVSPTTISHSSKIDWQS